MSDHPEAAVRLGYFPHNGSLSIFSLCWITYFIPCLSY